MSTQISTATLLGSAEWRTDSQFRTAPLTSALLGERIFDGQRVRVGNAYPRQRNYHGHYWLASTGTHTWHESLLERDALRLLDYAGDVVAVSSQPMKLTVDDRAHTPDYLALHADGTQTLIDVKPTSRIDERAREQFATTAVVCKQVGWNYRVLTETSLQVRVNLRYLSEFRRPECAVDDASEALTAPTLTIMLDVHTRLVLAFTLRLKATKSIDHVYLLGQALAPRQNRPDVTPFRTFLQAQMPEHTLLDADEYHALSHAYPYVRPRGINTDRGMDYLGSTFRAAAEYAGCDVTLSPPRTPTTKGHVERMFGTINTLFAATLPGYTGGDVTNRGHKPENEELLTIEMLWALFDDFLLRDYSRRPHASLRDRQVPTLSISPIEAASRSVLDIAQFAPAWGEMSYIGFLPTHWRAISDVGVQVGTRQYDSEALHHLRNTKSSHPSQGGKWPVKADPYNPDCVWVETAHGEYVECRERGIEDRNLRPLWEEVAEDPRALAAQFDAAVNGTPMPTPLPLPAFTIADAADDDLDYDHDFDQL